MKLIVDIPDTMYDWFMNGFPDNEDAVMLCETVIQSGKPYVPERKNGKIIYKHRHYHNVKHYTGEDENDGEIRTISVLEDYEWDDPYCEKCGRRIEDAQGLYCAYCGVKLEVGNG